MRCRDLTEHERVVDERAEVIDALHHRHPGRWQHHSRIVWCIQPNQHVGTRQARQTSQRARQHLRPDLRAAAAAAHRTVLSLGSRPPWRHRLLVHPHPAPIDPVLPAPDSAPGNGHAIPPGQRAPIAQPHDRQRLRLRPPPPQRLTARRSPQVLRQRRTRAHRPDAGFRPWVALDRSTVTGGEHKVMADAAQRRRHPHAARRIAVQPRRGQHRRAPPRRSPTARSPPPGSCRRTAPACHPPTCRP